jgi:putative flippase GtrA
MFKSLYHKYKEMILFVVFGVFTTLVNVVAYFISSRLCHFNVMTSTILAWSLAVMFAYVTNRKYVFKSENTSIKSVTMEFGAFISSRLLTGLLDLALMYIFVKVLGQNDVMIKIISNIIIVISNYLLSRLMVFRHHTTN